MLVRKLRMICNILVGLQAKGNPPALVQCQDYSLFFGYFIEKGVVTATMLVMTGDVIRTIMRECRNALLPSFPRPKTVSVLAINFLSDGLIEAAFRSRRLHEAHLPVRPSTGLPQAQYGFIGVDGFSVKV